MKKFVVLTILIIFFSETTKSQNVSIGGIVYDKINKTPLAKCVLILLNAKDSTISSYTRCNNSGFYEFKNILKGNYLILTTYPNYVEYIDKLKIDSTKSVYILDTIKLISRSKLLDEIILNTQTNAIKIKGDTTEYNASSFKLQPNANIEDLLKQLPGLQIDRNGQITAQGQIVRKILVDGEEFFGDDPTLITQNLRADVVDKIQIFDKKSDQSNFTGIEDGQKIKTVNLKIKKDKKNGYFGKLELGKGTNNFYNQNGMINLFKDKKKLAFYTINSNTGRKNLNNDESKNFGSGNVNRYNFDAAGGDLLTNFNINSYDTWDGNYNGEGLPTVNLAGLHYNNKWNKDKESINGNYNLNELEVKSNNISSIEYFLPNRIQYNNITQDSRNKILRNKFDGIYELQIDSLSNLKIFFDGGFENKTTNSITNSNSYRSIDSLLYKNTRNNTSLENTRFLNSNLLWRKKFRKKGRTISFSIQQSFLKDESNGFLYFNNNYFLPTLGSEIIDQKKSNINNNSLLGSKLTFSEPISKKSTVVINLGFINVKSASYLNSFNKNSISNKYTEIDSLFSNAYDFNISTLKSGIAFALGEKKFNLNLGTDVGLTNFTQKNIFYTTNLNRKFINYYPRAYFKYDLSNYKYLLLQYTGKTLQPSIQQIQPVINNFDPLNIVVGNPYLKSAFNNNIMFRFFNLKITTNRILQFESNYNFTYNQINMNTFVDPYGKQFNQFNNFYNCNNFLLNDFYYGYTLKKSDINLGTQIITRFDRYCNEINNKINILRNKSYTFKLSVDKYLDKQFSVSVSSSVIMNSYSYSINLDTTIKSLFYNLNVSADKYLPRKFQIHSELDFNSRHQTAFLVNYTNTYLLNVWVGKKILKNDAILFKVSVNDLLNQNNGYNRFSKNNYISQSTYNTIKRYYMIAVLWNFTKVISKK